MNNRVLESIETESVMASVQGAVGSVEWTTSHTMQSIGAAADILMPAGFMAGVREGMADVAEGRVIPWADVLKAAGIDQ